ncbi:hypothetical protein CDAR_434261 [Caerostris darwini]|uniref:Uncharacterized protein n=1 Tax=Caerostris darwini TaxID=1538125 RepID=A0AAV4UA31_9ARAC|nr:hypothetical protein CDAR_434261 [Caerostris darwini]
MFDLALKNRFYYFVVGGAAAVPQLSSALNSPSAPKKFKNTGGGAEHRRMPACHGARGGVCRKSDSFACVILKGASPFFHEERGGIGTSLEGGRSYPYFVALERIVGMDIAEKV